MLSYYSKNLIFKFKYTKKVHLKLTKEQILIRNRIQEKIDKAIYKLKYVPCLCGEKDNVVISETDRYGLKLNTVICKKCGLLRTNPRLDKDSLSEFYKKEYRDLYMESKNVEEEYFKNMVQRGREILGLIKKYCKETEFSDTRVIEIGCSAGGILVPFLETGAIVKGYDYDQRYLDYGNKHNPDMNLCFGGLESLESEGKKYDLIIINHVLEHLSDPKEAINLIKKSLKESGLLYIGVPGLKNPEYYYSPTKSFLGSLHIGHLFHFSRLSLIRLLKDFELLYIDDEIRAVCRLKNGLSNSDENLISEYNANLEFIEKYEKSFGWKFKRMKNILKNPHLIKLILPPSVIKLIQVIRKPIQYDLISHDYKR